MINRFIFILIAVSYVNLFSQTERLTKLEYYQKYIAKPGLERSAPKTASSQDRKRSVLDKGNVVLRMQNTGIYGYDPWGLNHEFPAGSMLKEGCCTYYWTAAPVAGALKNGVPSFSVGTM